MEPRRSLPREPWPDPSPPDDGAGPLRRLFRWLGRMLLRAALGLVKLVFWFIE